MARILDKLVVLDSDPAPLVARLVARQYAVLVAQDDDQLEAIAVRRRPDLIVGDLNANGSSPVGVCRRLKTNVLLRHVPIVVVTHRGELESRVAAVNGGADDYLVEPYDEGELFARINRAITRSRASLDANPLTRLPGNASIKAELDERLAGGGLFAVLFIDLDSFKAFNDRYGFERGDEALRVLGDIVLAAVDRPGNGTSSDFIGHIGGDDFVIVTSVDRAEPIAARICELVGQRTPYLYDDADRQAGCITSVDRQNQVRRFPLMTVSVAIVSNEDHRFRHHSEISQIGTEIKAYLKQSQGSCYLKNRRGVEPPPDAAISAAAARATGRLAAPAHL